MKTFGSKRNWDIVQKQKKMKIFYEILFFEMKTFGTKRNWDIR